MLLQTIQRMLRKMFQQHPKMIPALQVGMRYTTPGSKYRNDMQMRPIQLRSEHIPRVYEITEGKIPTGFSIALQKALSKGEIKLTSSDPAQQPILNYCYLTHPYDLERMRGAVRLCSEISARPEYEPAMMSRMSPSDEILENDEKLNDWLKSNGRTASQFKKKQLKKKGE